jgi:hypothetical protein
VVVVAWLHTHAHTHGLLHHRYLLAHTSLERHLLLGGDSGVESVGLVGLGVLVDLFHVQHDLVQLGHGV